MSDDWWEAYRDFARRNKEGLDGPRYAQDGDVFVMKWPDVFADFIELAHSWRQMDRTGTFAAAHAVVAREPVGIATEEDYRDFLACFDDPRKQERRSRYIPAKTRRRVLAAGECAACGSDEDLSVDHIKAFSAGGSNHISNLQCLCRSCNSAKGAKRLEEWLP